MRKMAMNEKLNHLLEYHYSLFYADCISRALLDDNISLGQFIEGLKTVRLAEREGIPECGCFGECDCKYIVLNGRNQFLADFDTLDEAIYYKEENEPKNELFSIECEILN